MIERTNLALAAMAVALAGLLWGAGGLLAATVGGALACGNLFVLRRLASRAVKRAAAEGAGQAGTLVAALMLKMMVLFALVWVAVAVWKLQVVPFAMGLSALVASLVIAPLFASPRKAEGASHG